MTTTASNCFNTPEEEAKFNISRNHQRMETAVRIILNPSDNATKWIVRVHANYINVAIEDPENEGKELFGHHFEIKLHQELDFKTNKTAECHIEVNYPCLGSFDPLAEPMRCELIRAMASVCNEGNLSYITCCFRDYAESIQAYRELKDKN